MKYGSESGGSSSDSNSGSSDGSDEEEDGKSGSSKSRKNDHFSQSESFKFTYEIYMRNSASQRFSSR